MSNKNQTPLHSLKKTVTYYSNQAKKYLPKNRKKVLELAKEELRILFGKN